MMVRGINDSSCSLSSVEKSFHVFTVEVEGGEMEGYPTEEREQLESLIPQGLTRLQ